VIKLGIRYPRKQESKKARKQEVQGHRSEIVSWVDELGAAHYPRSPVMKFGIRHPRKKERRVGVSPPKKGRKKKGGQPLATVRDSGPDASSSVFFLQDNVAVSWSWMVEDFGDCGTPTSVPQESYHHSGPSPIRPNELWTHTDMEPGHCPWLSTALGCECVRRGRGGDRYS